MKTSIHFLSYLAQFFWKWEMFQTYIVEQIKTHIGCSVTLFENRAVYAIRWKSFVEPGWPQMTIWCVRITCSTPKPTDTNTQFWHESAWLLRYTYIACFVFKFVRRIRGSIRQAEWARSTTQYLEGTEKTEKFCVHLSTPSPPHPKKTFLVYLHPLVVRIIRRATSFPKVTD
jgi:hypothetical protein